MAPHSSTLPWKIPWTEEPGGLPSMGSQSRKRLKRLCSSSSALQESYMLLFQPLSTPSHVAHNHYSGWMREKLTSLAASCIAGERCC